MLPQDNFLKNFWQSDVFQDKSQLRTYYDSKTTCFNACGGRKKLVSQVGRSELSEKSDVINFWIPVQDWTIIYLQNFVHPETGRVHWLSDLTPFPFPSPHSICSYSTCISVPRWLSICFYNLYLSHLLMALKIYNRGRETLGMSASTCSSYKVFTLMLSAPACCSIFQACPCSSRAALDCF